jgi:hypothetical protein
MLRLLFIYPIAILFLVWNLFNAWKNGAILGWPKDWSKVRINRTEDPEFFGFMCLANLILLIILLVIFVMLLANAATQSG